MLKIFNKIKNRISQYYKKKFIFKMENKIKLPMKINKKQFLKIKMINNKI